MTLSSITWVMLMFNLLNVIIKTKQIFFPQRSDYHCLRLRGDFSSLTRVDGCVSFRSPVALCRPGTSVISALWAPGTAPAWGPRPLLPRRSGPGGARAGTGTARSPSAGVGHPARLHLPAAG